jgi:hypothetical protein
VGAGTGAIGVAVLGAGEVSAGAFCVVITRSREKSPAMAVYRADQTSRPTDHEHRPPELK